MTMKDKDEKIENMENYQEEMNAQVQKLEAYGLEYINEQFRILCEENMINKKQDQQ